MQDLTDFAGGKQISKQIYASEQGKHVLLNVMEHLELEKRFDLNDKTTNYTVNSTIAKSKFNLLSFLVAAKLASAAILPQ